MTLRDREIDRIDAGGDAWSASDKVVEIEIRQPLDKVIPVRLTTSQYDSLRKEAARLGVGPSTLARMRILESLRLIPQRREPKAPRVGRPAVRAPANKA